MNWKLRWFFFITEIFWWASWHNNWQSIFDIVKRLCFSVFTCCNFKISNLPPLFCWFLSLLLLPLVWLEVLLTKCLELLVVAAEFTNPVLAELLLLLSLLPTPLTPPDKLELATIFPQDRDDEDTWWPSSAAAAMPWQFDEFFRMLFAAPPPLFHNGAFSRVFIQ